MPVTARRTAVVGAAILAGGLSALVSAIAAMTAVWLMDGGSAQAKWIVVLGGTAVGAAVGGWWSQPPVARVLAAMDDSGLRGWSTSSRKCIHPR